MNTELDSGANSLENPPSFLSTDILVQTCVIRSLNITFYENTRVSLVLCCGLYCELNMLLCLENLFTVRVVYEEEQDSMNPNNQKVLL